jgi:hypothetical protein
MVIASCNIGLSTVYDIRKWKAQLESFVASCERVNSPVKQTLEKPRLAQLDKLVCKWFTAMHSEGKTRYWAYDNSKVRSSCNEYSSD